MNSEESEERYCQAERDYDFMREEELLMSEERTITGCKHTQNEDIYQEYVCGYCEDEKDAKTQWQPIETAPRDGTVILFYSEDGRIESGEWVEKEDDGTDSMGSDAGWMSQTGMTFPGRSFGNPIYFSEPQEPPTHWMRLPPPPETES